MLMITLISKSYAERLSVPLKAGLHLKKKKAETIQFKSRHKDDTEQFITNQRLKTEFKVSASKLFLHVV